MYLDLAVLSLTYFFDTLEPLTYTLKPLTDLLLRHMVHFYGLPHVHVVDPFCAIDVSSRRATIEQRHSAKKKTWTTWTWSC